MKGFRQSASIAFFAASVACAADTTYWVEPCSKAETNCTESDVELARWAMQAWQDASSGKLHFVPAQDESHALIRLVWATPSLGLYGETRPIEVNGRRGAQIFVRIAGD